MTPSLYDLVIHIRKITVEDAVDIISQMTALEHFRTMPESQRVVNDLVLAARVRAQLVDTCPSVRVRASDQVVYVDTQAGPTAVE